MRMTLPEGEPEAGPWRVVPFADLVDLILDAAGTPILDAAGTPAVDAAGTLGDRPRIVAVDGRGAGGKTTIAARLADAVPSAVVVHTDDIAWHHSFFGWAGLLADGVLEPARRGAEVRYRPPAWDERGRAGAVVIPSGTSLVVVEGVGAGRRELARLLDAVVWVQSDFAEAERRGIIRDLAEGVNGDREQATAFWHEWMAEELPFQADQRPWERACVIVAGTPGVPLAPGDVMIAPPPEPD